MTDIKDIAEYIHNAMQAVEQANEASQELRQQPTPEKLDTFKDEMETLCQHLQNLQRVLEHQEGYFVEELTDLLHQLISGEHAPYRSMPRLNNQ